MADPSEMRSLVGAVVPVVAEYDDRAMGSQLPAIGDLDEAARSVFDAVAGFGALQGLLDDRDVEEIWVNEPGRVFAARKGVSELTNIVLPPTSVRDIVERMLKS